MKITEIRLKNFKRFTDLVIRDIPESAKLVLIVGPNGCGKSSLFDALIQWYRSKVGFGFNQDELYYRKNSLIPFGWNESVSVTTADGAPPEKGSLYVRSAYRNDPDFSISGIGRLASPIDNLRLARAIDNDQAVSDNYQRLVYDTMAGVYDSENDQKSVINLREELIGQVKSSMATVFGDLILNNISDPLGAGAFFFQKGEIGSYHYKNLSGGEKAAFDLILDLHIKKKFYKGAVYCVDEIETHLHTKVQGKLLSEMVNILPEGGQLWVTTHSLGVLRSAQEIAIHNPGAVAIIDFDSVDPDISREIFPSNLGRVSWEKLLSIAIDDLSSRLAPKVICICEGSSIGSGRKNFDADIYNRIFESQFTDLIFVSGGSSSQLAQSGISIKETLKCLYPAVKIITLRDRDDLSESEVSEINIAGNIVLPRRNLEDFLFSDEVLEALVIREKKEDLLDEVLNAKMTAIANSTKRGNPPDDIKSASGEIYTEIKRILGLKQAGNSADSFMRDTLAHLVNPSMPIYLDLYQAIKNKI